MTATLAAPIGTRQHHYPTVTKTVPAMARGWAAKQLAELGATPDLIDNALLVISELVTNVWLHAPGEADLSVGYDQGHLVITCADRGSNTLPELDRPNDDNEHGRGLLLIHALCTQVWARRRLGNGKRVIACIEGAAA